MKITFYGGARCVTGSCILLEACNHKILIDCGLSQGEDSLNSSVKCLPFDPKEIDIVFITHGHIDHIGRLPLLVKGGYKGRIICTEATANLCEILLLDSAAIMDSDASYEQKDEKILFTKKDVEDTMVLFSPYLYEEKFPISEIYYDKRTKTIDKSQKITGTLIDAGHILGSSSIVLEITEKGQETKTIVFSGDIGNINQPIIEDPKYIKVFANYVVMECTYGNKEHKVKPTTESILNNLKTIVDKAIKNNGKIIIPAFAVGRTQEIIYLLKLLMLQTSFSIPVFVDSPLAIKGTEVFKNNVFGYYDEEAMALINKGENPLNFPSLILLETTSQSKALNTYKGPCIIIASSGMCEGGRIRHHIKNHISNSNNTIIFTGYQAKGTLGYVIKNGGKTIKLFGQTIEVKASICTLEGISGHSDKKGLLYWLSSIKPKPQKVFLNHGDEKTILAFEKELKNKGYETIAPSIGNSYTL
ncbi:MAG: MBL fold metallo-hydrolase [Sphaerochaetaceae bacterium]|nr:MBL fold metallo-hydrolase [Sphaerochaetaceae bacterium]